MAQESGSPGDTPIWKPPRVSQSDVAPKPTVRKPMIGSIRIADFRIVLGQTTMKQAQRRLGGEPGSEGDAGDYLEWLCFRGRGAQGTWVLWLESGEIDGGDVGSVQWRSISPAAKVDARCGVLPKSFNVVQLPIPIRLGASEGEVLQLLGEPTGRENNAVLYIEMHEEILHGQPFTEYNAVTLEFRNGIVTAIQVEKSITS
jgi:hypothetical protein